MSTIGWILLIALFVGVHLLMHRGHGSHSARGGTGRARREGHQHSAESDGDTTATSEPRRHSHRGS